MSISPNVPSPQESYHYESAGTPRWIAVLFGLLFAAIAVLGYVGHQAETRLEGDLSKQEDNNKLIQAQLEQANTRLADLKGHLDVTEQKIGMTRAELLKVFTTEGGLSTATHRTFVYRDCAHLKIDVDFNLSDSKQNALEERPTDTISKISKPYLDWSICD